MYNTNKTNTESAMKEENVYFVVLIPYISGLSFGGCFKLIFKNQWVIERVRNFFGCAHAEGLVLALDMNLRRIMGMGCEVCQGAQGVRKQG